jgi:hypothetical protein
MREPKQGIGRALEPEFELKYKEANKTKRVVKRILNNLVFTKV